MDLAEVISGLAPRLIAYLCARTGNRALAEDLAQDALIALVQTWRRHGPPDSPDAFVFAIAKRRAGRALRGRPSCHPSTPCGEREMPAWRSTWRWNTAKRWTPSSRRFGACLVAIGKSCSCVPRAN